MLRLEKITRENWRKAVFVTTDPTGLCPLDEEWAAGTAFSMLQAVYEPEWDCRLILLDAAAVGFAFFGRWKEDRILLCRYAIDVEFQGKGYGQEALPLVLKEMRAQYGTEKIYVTLDQKNKRAVHLYQKHGFRDTGEVDEGENVYVLDGAKD